MGGVYNSSPAYGPTADGGNAGLLPSVPMAGTDGSGKVRTFATDTTGHVSVIEADGANATQGAKADTKATDSTSAWSVVAILKGLYALLSGTITAAISGTVAVTGTFWQAVQPVSQPDPAATTGNITAADVASTTSAGAPGQTLIAGTPTANSAVVATVSGFSSVAVILSNTFVGTVQFEESSDGGTTYVNRGVYIAGTPNSVLSSTTPGVFGGNLADITTYRVRCTAYTSGTVTVRVQPGYGVGHPRTVAVVGGGAAGAAVAGNPVLIGVKDGSGNAQTAAGDTAGNQLTLTAALQSAPIALFDQTVNQAGVTQSALLFPTTITGGLPAIGSGSVANLTNAGNVCGAIFSPKAGWDSVLLDIIGVGGASTNTITIEIGRLKAAGAVPDVLASVVLTASATTLGATTTNPLTGAGGHSSVTWRFIDAIAITAVSQLGDVLVSINGVTAKGPSQLVVNVHDAEYYYVLITALHANWVEVLSTITPKS